MKNWKASFLTCGLQFVLCTALFAQQPFKPDAPAHPLWLPAIFGDHMVLQQGQDLPVWGKTKPGEKVTISIARQTAEVTADAEGNWMVHLLPLPINAEAVELSVTSAGTTRSFKDVLVGDVWLCAGQSNMAMNITKVNDDKSVFKKKDHDRLRLFVVKRQVGIEGCEDVQGEWVVSTPEEILPTQTGGRGFSAVGYFFGRELAETQARPIGLIGSYAGGTPLEAWTSLETLLAFPGKRTATEAMVQRFMKVKKELPKTVPHHAKVLLPAWEKELAERNEKHRLALETYRKELLIAKEKNLPVPPRPVPAKVSRRPLEPNRNPTLASVLFNGMIEPLIPFAITGVIWYQGEANAYPQKAEEYGTLFPMMISDWRARWGQGDFPFLFVQLPNLDNNREAWPILRDSQRQALSLSNTGMAVTIDVGDPKDLHPAIKKPVADRLALLARDIAYKEKIVSSGPLLKSATVDGDRVRLKFSQLGSGLLAGQITNGHLVKKTNQPLVGFEIAGQDGSYVSAHASIENQGVTLWNDEVSNPQFVRYGWAPKPQANLYNQEGLPAVPFQQKLN